MQHFSSARRHRAAAHAALFALLGWVALGSACQTDSEKKAAVKPPPPVAAAPKPAALPAPAPKGPPPKPLQWDDPPQWKKVPATGMRVGSYQIPPAPGDKEIAELNIFSLGGDVNSNIQRWIDEFSGFDAKALYRADRVVNELPESVVEVPKGKFSGGMGESDGADNFGLLGAIVSTADNIQYFFKLTGPSATVRAARDPFYHLLDSVRMEGGTAAPNTARTIKTVGGAAVNEPVTGAGGAPNKAAPVSGAAKPTTRAPSATPPAKH